MEETRRSHTALGSTAGVSPVLGHETEESLQVARERPWMRRVTILGPIGTAVGTLVAAVALLFNVRALLDEREASVAADARANISAVLHEAEALSEMLLNGSGILIGANGIRHELETRIYSGAVVSEESMRSETKTSIQKAMENGRLRISVAVTGLDKSGLSRRVSLMLNDGRRPRGGLTGHLAIVSSAHVLLDRIAANTFSPVTYADLMLAVADVNSLDEFEEELGDIARSLFIAGHRCRTVLLNRLIQDTAASLVSLEDGDLVLLSRLASTQTGTYTENIGQMLDVLRAYIDDQAYQRLHVWVHQLDEEFNRSASAPVYATDHVCHIEDDKVPVGDA